MTTMPYQTKFGLSGSTLKCIALVTMFIDHIGATIIEGILNRDYPTAVTNDSYAAFLESHAALISANSMLRGIGRLAFPIFCFLLVEGFLHTKNLKKYAIRLFLFALLSEIPFDLAMENTLFSFSKQNVFFTLFLGLVMIWLLEQIKKKYFAYPLFLGLGSVLVIGIFMAAANLLRVDYADTGIAVIAVLFLLQNNRMAASLIACVLLCLSNSTQAPCLISVFLIGLYNGTRGMNIKYFFYAFYPAHLLFFYVVRLFT